MLYGKPEVPSSKYYTLRYLLAAILAEGVSRISFLAESDDSDVLLRGCQALGAECFWEDEQRRILRVKGVGRPRSMGPLTINVGNAGAVLRFLLGLGAFLSEVTFITDHPQSLGKRPNRELLEALTMLGATCQGTGSEGCLPITLRGGNLHGGRVTISGARSSQYISSLLFLAPLLEEKLEIVVVDGLKSQPLVRTTLDVLQEAGIVVEYDESVTPFFYCSPGNTINRANMWFLAIIPLLQRYWQLVPHPMIQAVNCVYLACDQGKRLERNCWQHFERWVLICMLRVTRFFYGEDVVCMVLNSMVIVS